MSNDNEPNKVDPRHGEEPMLHSPEAGTNTSQNRVIHGQKKMLNGSNRYAVLNININNKNNDITKDNEIHNKLGLNKINIDYRHVKLDNSLGNIAIDLDNKIDNYNIDINTNALNKIGYNKTNNKLDNNKIRQNTMNNNLEDNIDYTTNRTDNKITKAHNSINNKNVINI